MDTPLYLGIDAGSTASKCVLVDASGEIVARGLHKSGAGTDGPQKAINAALAMVNATRGDVSFACATGYGRNLMEGADAQVSELTCHAKGATKLFPGVRTVVDIGGQDAKVLKVNAQGKLANFVMNDKCAAGTGRFLDVMASIFGCEVGNLSSYDEHSTEALSISSTCTVFAESEVISKLSKGEPIANIVAGIHASVVERTYGLMRRVGIEPAVAMTGGVALNDGLRNRLEQRAGCEILTSPLAQFNGALGAALCALENSK